VPDESAGVLAHVASHVLSAFAFRRQGLVPGDDALSVLARAEYHLNEKDLDSATRELNQLRGTAKALLKDWLEAARRRLEVQQALEVCCLFVQDDVEVLMAALFFVGRARPSHPCVITCRARILDIFNRIKSRCIHPIACLRRIFCHSRLLEGVYPPSADPIVYVLNPPKAEQSV
jgi:hypothetical protein